jgi:DNA-binding transcriptional LysR family regulator
MTISRLSILGPFQPASGTRPEVTERNLIETLPLGDLAEYWCVVAVAEELHFTRAARRLHMDQSAVSRHIQRLEAKLGIKLFARSGRGVELTNAGKGFIPYARNSLVSAGNGERFAQAIARGDPREIEVAYSPVVDMHLIAQISRLVDGVRPRLPVRFQSVASEKLAERLFEGASHAAIGILPVGHEIVKACILREKLLIALPTTHRLAQGDMIHAAQLSDDPVIWTFGVEDSTVSKHFIGLLGKAGYIPNMSRQAQSVAEALGLVREGFGVTLVKTSELRLHPEGIIIRPFSEPSLVVETGLLYLAENPWGFVTEFVSLVTQNLRCAEHAPSG